MYAYAFETLLACPLRSRLLPWKHCCHGNGAMANWCVIVCARQKGPDPSLMSENQRERERERERERPAPVVFVVHTNTVI